jgi:peptidoglycan/LPS O-acetylase OafA/YrhL
MIPRAQSLWLLLVAAAGMLMLMLPLSTIKITPSGFEGSPARVIEMNAFSKTETAGEAKTDEGTNKLLPWCIILSAVVALIALFLVKNSQAQLKLCGLNYVIICLTLVLIFFYCDLQTSTNNILMTSEYHAGAIMPFLQLLGNFFALRRIKLDARALTVMQQL